MAVGGVKNEARSVTSSICVRKASQIKTKSATASGIFTHNQNLVFATSTNCFCDGMKLKCDLYNFAGQLIDYSLSWKFQKAMLEHIHHTKKSGQFINDALMIVQHPSIYTLGRGASETNLKFQSHANSEHMVVRVERGGEVTWHGPGQLVAYPIFDLSKHKKDLHWFTNQLEQTVIETLATFSSMGERSEVNTGVWIGNNKISAVGVTASRWTTMHGISLNVNCDLNNFGRIIPCGITATGRGVCSMQSLAGQVQDLADSSTSERQLAAASQRWTRAFSEVFCLEMIEVEEPAAVLHSLLDRYPLIQQSTLPRTIT